jgi:hypothetical protein
MIHVTGTDAFASGSAVLPVILQALPGIDSSSAPSVR